MLACILKQEMKVEVVMLVVTEVLDATPTTRTTDLRVWVGDTSFVGQGMLLRRSV
jgi:hypothetical protein